MKKPGVWHYLGYGILLSILSMWIGYNSTWTGPRMVAQFLITTGMVALFLYGVDYLMKRVSPKE